jgi:UDP-4-amino-4,6-dideoxy-N-acetyl-beta-L-altrosamine transaminase
VIPYARQDVTDADVEAVLSALRSDFLTQGPAVPRFERATAAVVGAEHALAMNSATSALHAACVALELGPGDRLWTVPNTFVASANCARYCGAEVDFIDIDARSWNMCPDRLEAALADAQRSGRLPKVVAPVHFAGQPTAQERIRDLSSEYGFHVLEDASHAIGATRSGEPVGSCRWSDITILSFHAVKIITSGEGGMALTNDRDLAGRMALIRSHGITRDPERMSGPVPGEWYYQQQMLGYNYRLTDVQAALGESQLQRLPGYVSRRNALAMRYHELLADLPVQLPTVSPENRSAYHLYVIRIDGEATRGRDVVFKAMRAAGIGVNVHYMPVHLQPYYRALGFNPGYCPEAEAHGVEALTLPLHPRLTEAEQDRVAAALAEAL